MDERVKFIARLLDGETMSGLCREFGISRKTGYKIDERYRDCGVEGLTDRSRRPYRHANQLPFQIETLIVRLKRERPAWGAPKIRERLARLYPDIQRPAISTVHAVLDRHGLVTRRKKTAQQSNRDAAVVLQRAQRAVVRRLQGRVHARGTVRNFVREAMMMEGRIITWLLRRKFWTSCLPAAIRMRCSPRTGYWTT